MMITRLAAFASAFLAKSSASLSVSPPLEAHIAQVSPFYVKGTIKFKASNYDGYSISRICVSFVGQKQRESLGVTTS
jgi:hypothetical protein